jgi:uncharacterized protein with beta-barrel porin domain
VLTSNSNIIGNVTNYGKVAPGNSIGVITITGNYTQNPGSVYEVETDTQGQSDKLVVTGTATSTAAPYRFSRDRGSTR